MRTCELADVCWILGRTGDIAIDIIDILCSPCDQGGARVDNCCRIGDFNGISVDCDRTQRELPLNLYRVNVEWRQLKGHLVILSPHLSADWYKSNCH